MLRTTAQSWGAAAKFLHWLMAVMLVLQIALGWAAVSWRLSPTKLDLFVWHKSLGLVVLLLALLRLAWRFADRRPDPPAGEKPWERRAAQSVHALLYALMIVLPLNGWVINSAANIPFRVFWLFPLPAIVAPDKPLADAAAQLHFLLFVTLTILVLLHVGAALRHHFVKRNDVLVRMLPTRRARA